MTREEAIEYLNTLYMAFAVFPNQQISLGDVDKMKESVSMAISALSQEPSGDLISRQAVIDACEQSINILEAVDRIMDLSSVKQESKTGHWIYQKGYVPYKWKCNQCSAKVRTDFNYCPNCGCRMVEPQESETWNGIHAQITAPKGTFERIFNEVDDENDI